MKKTLVALLVASAATTVSAGEIYSTDSSVVKLKGEVDAYLAKKEVDNGTTKTETDPDVNVWAKIQLDAEHKISDSLTGFASFEIESGSAYDSTDNNAKFDDVYVGVKTDVWGVAVGEVGDLADSMDAIQKDDITNEGEYMGSTGGHRAESAGHGAVFKAKVTDGLVFVADVNTESNENIDNTVGASLDWAINDMFSVGASYVSGEQAADTDYSVMGVSASVDVEGFYFAATYGAFEGNNSWGLFGDEDANGNANTYYDGDAYGVAASYTIEKTRLYTTYAVMSLDEATVSGADANGDTSNWVLGVDYALLDNVTIFGEYQTAETSNDFSAGANQDADTVVLGAYYTF
ncbi:porin [Vibrio coralliilyticus]|uniref:porin n=1 Tax=Vibrio coralliilyticus TaxID=190893 RepID=UPI00148BFEC9|nr:porin [Vibrio coralliilyticus]NOH53852.1 porin [Vibrio coralliilyticus]